MSRNLPPYGQPAGARAQDPARAAPGRGRDHCRALLGRFRLPLAPVADDHPGRYAKWCVYALVLLAPGSFLVLPLLWLRRRRPPSSATGTRAICERLLAADGSPLRQYPAAHPAPVDAQL